MVIIGLTGSIGMGKTTAAGMLQEMGVPVHCADTVVHELLAQGGGAVLAVAEAFPGTLESGAINRKKLGAAVFGHEAELKRLQDILHPMVFAETEKWCRAQEEAGVPLVVLDIPLLYEKQRDVFCDQVWVVSAPYEVQRARVLSRPGMTEERLLQILSQQVPDEEKRRRADVVIPTGDGLEETRAHLQAALEKAKKSV